MAIGKPARATWVVRLGPRPAERWRQVEELYQAALDRTPAERRALLAERCKGDEDLRIEVESLLRTRTWANRSSGQPETDAPDPPASSELPEGAQLGPYRVESL